MVEAIFAPQSVAIVGASPAPRKQGYRPLRNVVENGYIGRTFSYHPFGAEIPETHACPSIHACPEPTDLAAIVMPSDTHADALMRCVTFTSLSHSKLCLLDAAQGDGHGNPLCRLD